MTKCSSTVAISSLPLFSFDIQHTQPNPKSPYPLQTVTAVIDCRENTWDLYSLSQWQVFLSVAVFHAHPNAFNAPSVILSLTGPGWICLRLNDKTKPPLLSPPAPLTPGLVLYCSHAPLPASSDTGCIIYVEKILPGQASIWPSWNINLANLAPSLQHHIITKMTQEHCQCHILVWTCSI